MMKLAISFLLSFFAITSFGQVVKIPVTEKYLWQDNSQQDRPSKLVDGDTTSNYSPARPIIYTQDEITFDLFDFNATVDNVKMWIAGSDTCTVQVVVVRKRDFHETIIGTFSGGTNQHFTYSNAGDTAKIAYVILRTSSSNYQFGSEVEILGTYTTPTTPTAKPRRPLGWLSGTVAHSWDLMNDAKLNAVKSINLTNIRAWENGYDVTNSADAFKFEPELGTDRYSTDSAFGILHRWNPNIYTWKVVTGQFTPQQNSWSVIDNFPNRYIKGTVTSYLDHGSWGEVFMNVTQVAQPTGYQITLWYVYKNGVQINITSTPEYFNSDLVGQNRHFNVGGSLGIVAGDVLYFYKSQASVNPIYFSANDLPMRNLDSSYQLDGANMYVYASRGGANASVPSYTLQTTSPAQRLLKGARIYNAVEPANEPNAWWTTWLGFWNGATVEHLMSTSYDGSKNTYANTGAKTADSTIDVLMSGMATDFQDQIYGAIEEARKQRGYNVDGTVNVPFTAVNMHIYPSAGGQYGYGNNGGLPWEQGAGTKVKAVINLLERRAPNTKYYITEWGWDQNANSPLHAGVFGSYDREAVGAFWMVRAMLWMAANGVDRSTYYTLFQDWPESSSNNSGSQFATMRLLSQPIDSDPTVIVRSRQGDYMAQYNEFKNFTYSDSLSTGQDWLHGYKYTSGDTTLLAVWGEEIASIVSDTTQFAERTGTLNVSIPSGTYQLRQFQDNGSVYTSSTQLESTGTVSVSYAAKPVLLEYITPTPPAVKRRGIVYY